MLRMKLQTIPGTHLLQFYPVRLDESADRLLIKVRPCVRSPRVRILGWPTLQVCKWLYCAVPCGMGVAHLSTLLATRVALITIYDPVWVWLSTWGVPHLILNQPPVDAKRAPVTVYISMRPRRYGRRQGSHDAVVIVLWRGLWRRLAHWRRRRSLYRQGVRWRRRWAHHCGGLWHRLWLWPHCQTFRHNPRITL